jgi:hypothetical protein
MKYVLLKSRVPTTYDGGFRASGYEVLEIIESDTDLQPQKDLLERFLDSQIKLQAVKSIKIKQHDK